MKRALCTLLAVTACTPPPANEPAVTTEDGVRFVESPAPIWDLGRNDDRGK